MDSVGPSRRSGWNRNAHPQRAAEAPGADDDNQMDGSLPNLSQDQIILGILNSEGSVQPHVMHGLYKSTDALDVKMNLVHILYRVQKFGTLPIEQLKEMLTPSELQMFPNPSVTKTWYSMPLQVFTLVFLREEISQATDAAIRRYNETTLEDERTLKELGHAIAIGANEKTNKLKIKMSKLVAVADPANKPSFIEEIRKHWSSNEVSEMTLEKLTMVATCNTTADHKIKFLKWWNSSQLARDARRFPPRPVLLGLFLNRCIWYAGIEDAVLQYFDDVVRQENIIIDMKVLLQPESLPEYLEGWRQKIWDEGFLAHLRGANCFKKSDKFCNHEGSDQAIRRVLFRYFKLELEAKGAIQTEDLPPLLSTFLDFNSASCMYTAN